MQLTGAVGMCGRGRNRCTRPVLAHAHGSDTKAAAAVAFGVASVLFISITSILTAFKGNLELNYLSAIYDLIK